MTFDHSPVPPNRALDAALHALPGRKLIFTNGTVAHAEKVLARIGITHHFGDIFDIVHSDFIPKPRWVPTASSWRRPASVRRPRPCSRTLPAISRRRMKLGMNTVLVVSDQNRDATHLNAASGGR